MKDFILKYPFFYRLYQNLVRKKKDEYQLFKYVFSQIKENNSIRLLDICCGDSYVLNYINEYLDDYMGIDNNPKYLKNLSIKWPKFKFYQLDIESDETLKIIKNYNPNFIFINGAIHHLNDNIVQTINSIFRSFHNCRFLSVDPVAHKNNLINKIMIHFDRGKFIRSSLEYERLMKNFESIIIDDFYIMSFKNLFHYKNFQLPSLYKDWKKL